MSGIYIPGMEMSKDDVTIIEIHSSGATFRITSSGGWEKVEDAVPVPPHGRLIDADAYESLLRGLGDRNYRREKGTICDAIKLLHPHYAPTIIPADKEGEG